MRRSAFWGGFCASDSKICGTGSRSCPCRRMLPTTPTTVYHGPSESGGPNLNRSAQRVAAGPRAASHRLVDDRDPRGLGPIADRKETAAEQRGPDGLEEIRADLVSCEPQALSNRSGVAFDSEDLFPGVTNEQIADDAGALDTGNRLNLFEETVVQVDPLSGDADRLAQSSRRARSSEWRTPS